MKAQLLWFPITFVVFGSFKIPRLPRDFYSETLLICDNLWLSDGLGLCKSLIFRLIQIQSILNTDFILSRQHKIKGVLLYSDYNIVYVLITKL